MNITKAVITAAGPDQRHLPLQTLIDRDGKEKPLFRIIIEEVRRAGVEEIGVIIHPDDEAVYSGAAGDTAGCLTFIPQKPSLGYAHAVFCAEDFVGGNPFLHLVGDHLWVSPSRESSAQQLLQVAEAEDCTVSAVQVTREGLLPYFGAVGGRRVKGRKDLYQIECVLEKPTPTQAEQQLIVPGIRSGHYLCFFGMHVLPPTLFELLKKGGDSSGGWDGTSLSAALSELAGQEQYLAFELSSRRYDVGVRYGLFTAQLALALSGQDRDQVLNLLLEFFARRESRLNER